MATTTEEKDKTTATTADDKKAKPTDPKKLSGKTTTMTFPKPVTLTLPDCTTQFFPAGTQEVPEEYADNPYLADCGVKPYDKSEEKKAGDKGKEPEPPKAPNDEEDVKKAQDVADKSTEAERQFHAAASSQPGAPELVPPASATPDPKEGNGGGKPKPGEKPTEPTPKAAEHHAPEHHVGVPRR